MSIKHVFLIFILEFAAFLLGCIVAVPFMAALKASGIVLFVPIILVAYGVAFISAKKFKTISLNSIIVASAFFLLLRVGNVLLNKLGQLHLDDAIMQSLAIGFIFWSIFKRQKIQPK